MEPFRVITAINVPSAKKFSQIAYIWDISKSSNNIFRKFPFIIYNVETQRKNEVPLSLPLVPATIYRFDDH